MPKADSGEENTGECGGCASEVPAQELNHNTQLGQELCPPCTGLMAAPPRPEGE